MRHVVVPADYASGYPYAPDGRMPLTGENPIPDSLDWLSFLAAHTQRLRLGTAVIILPDSIGAGAPRAARARADALRRSRNHPAVAFVFSVARPGVAHDHAEGGPSLMQ